MSTAADFIGTLFVARDVAHSVHLNTRSFSKHMALNDFYHEEEGELTYTKDPNHFKKILKQRISS